jgi:hypothetical protein
MRTIIILALGTAALATGGCAYDMERAYAGATWEGERHDPEDELRGPGVEILDRWLAETPEGRTIVTLGFRDMRITDEEIRVALVAAAGRHMR